MAAIEVDFSRLDQALTMLGDRARIAVRSAAEAMGAKAEQAIEKELGTSSHARGTQTPSAPGSPPSLISGSLRRSVRKTFSAPVGASQWEVRIAPTIVYARIQELGGVTGWHHRTRLPPRPYVTPAVIQSAPAIEAAATAVFARIIVA